MVDAAESLSSLLDEVLHSYEGDPAAPYVRRLLERPILEPSFGGAPPEFPKRLACMSGAPLSVRYSNILSLAKGVLAARRRDADLGAYRKRILWLGRVAREQADALLIRCGLFPESLLRRRRAPLLKIALGYGGIFYELATRLGGVPREPGSFLSTNFEGWAGYLNGLKEEFDLWARDAETLLELQRNGVKAFENVVLLH